MGANNKKGKKRPLKPVVNHAPTVALPPYIHAQGDTWRHKNTPTRIKTNAPDLNDAVKKRRGHIEGYGG
jgi:hypothetical protein